MRGLGRMSIGSVHARGIRGIGFSWMQILEDDPRGIGRFDMFEETWHVGMQGLGDCPSGVCTLVTLEELIFVDANPWRWSQRDWEVWHVCGNLTWGNARPWNQTGSSWFECVYWALITNLTQDIHKIIDCSQNFNWNRCGPKFYLNPTIPERHSLKIRNYVWPRIRSL